MDPTLIGLIGLTVMLIALLFGVPIAAILGIIGLLGMAALAGWQAALSMAATAPFHTIADEGFAALVLFLMMGMIVEASGLAELVYDSLNKWFGRLPGGMLMATILGAGVFGACSGSSLATAVFFGRVASPHLVKYGHHPALACGIACVGGTLAALIPPSGLLIIYGLVSETSIAHLFLAGLIPGIVNILLYFLIIFFVAKLRPQLAPKGSFYSWRERISSANKVWPLALIGVFIISSLYFGIATPTEIGGLGAFFCLIVTISVVGIRRARVPKAMFETAREGAMILVIVATALMFGRFLTMSRLPEDMVNWIANSGIHPAAILASLVIMYIVMGMFIGSIELIVITTPIVLPLLTSLGFHPIWWGVVLVQLCEIGLMTPPMGMICYLVKGTVGELATLEQIFMGALLFALSDFILLALILIFPDLVLFLPNRM